MFRTKQNRGSRRSQSEVSAPELSAVRWSKHALRRWGLRTRAPAPTLEGAQLAGTTNKGARIYFLPRALCWLLVMGRTVITVLQQRPRNLHP